MPVDQSQGHARPAAQGPIDLSRSPAAVLRPVDSARLGVGFWGKRARLNSEVGIPSGIERLRAAGNLENLQLAAARETSGYRGDLPFLDSDVYKWLEAAAFEARHGERPELEAFSSEVISLLARAQEPDGYLQSYFQVKRPGERYVDLQWGHELYCAGHLLQAAIARARVLSDEALLDVGLRFVDSIVAELGANAAREGVGGHPEIEMALVELYRLTRDVRHLELAQLLIDRRGHGLLGVGRFGSAYWQDDIPVREAAAGRGHAVRQLYLLCGVVDAYLESGEESLLVAAERQWLDIVAYKTYLTGGQGARHTDESFGDAWELPPDRAYCETCAAIGSIMLSWRLLLATGKARYAELIERTLYNGFLSGASLDGEGYRYVNPLQVRHARAGVAGDQGPYFSRWFRCACCPPNVMRLLASLEDYVCARRGDGLILHQFISGDYGDDELKIHVETGYPYEGAVHVRVAEAPSYATTITLRIPQWAEGASLSVNGDSQPLCSEDGWLTLERAWRQGDRIEMELPLAVRMTRADSRVDAVRSSVALERGPLVYCVEEADNLDMSLDEIAEVLEAAAVEHDPELLGGVTPLRVEVELTARAATQPWWPYGSDGAPGATVRRSMIAVPFYTWGNRTQGAMRVWMPSPAVPRAATRSTS